MSRQVANELACNGIIGRSGPRMGLERTLGRVTLEQVANLEIFAEGLEDPVTAEAPKVAYAGTSRSVRRCACPV